MKQSEKILILSASEEIRLSLAETAAAVSDEICTGDGTDIRNRDLSLFGTVIIAVPLAAEYGIDLAAHICRSSEASVILLVPQKSIEDICRRTADTGIYVLPRNAGRQCIIQAIRFMSYNRRRLSVLTKEKDQLSEKIRENKLIHRAKCALMHYLSISENEAHRQIQKLAMDSRISLADAAVNILKNYEYL